MGMEIRKVEVAFTVEAGPTSKDIMGFGQRTLSFHIYPLESNNNLTNFVAKSIIIVIPPLFPKLIQRLI